MLPDSQVDRQLIDSRCQCGNPAPRIGARRWLFDPEFVSGQQRPVAVKQLRPATHLGLGSATVERVASSRRVRTPDGRIVARMSAGARNPALADTPVVAVTSYAMPGDRDRALAAGCDGYIEKPINPDTFVSEVARYLKPATGKATS